MFWRKKIIITPCHWHPKREAVSYLFAGNIWTGKWINACQECVDYINGVKR